MVIVDPDPLLLRNALDAQTRRLVDLLRTARSPLDRSVPGLDWTAAQVVAHLCVVYRAFGAAIRGEDVGADIATAAGSAATLPETVAAVNALMVRGAAFAPDEAAEALAASAAELAGALDARPDLALARPTPWYGAGVTRTVGTLAALSVSESLVHGYDLARALDADAIVDARFAAAAAPTVMSAMLPLLVDQRGAAGVTAAFDIRVRGARPFVLRLESGRAWAEHPDGRDVDCVISLSGPAALLVGFRRVPLWRAVVTGAALAYGRRPWLALGFPRLFLSA